MTNTTKPHSTSNDAPAPSAPSTSTRRFGRAARRLTIAAAFIALAALWWSWRSGQPTAPEGFTVLLDGAPKGIDPRFSTSDFSVKLSRLVFSGLVTVDNATGDVELDLAKDIKIVSPTHYEITLRDDALWHDGKPVTAADVHYTFTTLNDPKVRSPFSGFGKRIERIDIHDPHHFSIHLKDPHAPFLADLAFGIVPKHLLEESGVFPDNTAVGSGPFKLHSRQGNVWVSLEAFDQHHKGRPKLDTVVFRIMPDDNTRVLALMGGSGQMAQNAVSPLMVPVVERDPDLEVVSAPSFKYTYLGLNLAREKLADLRVRQAIALAIDRQEIIKYKFNGTARLATGLLAPSHWAYNGQVETYSRDLERAKALLDEAGYTDPDGDGPLPRFEITYKTTTNKFRRAIAELLASQLAEVGIKVKVLAFEWGTFFTDIKSGNFDMCSLQWPSVIEPDLYTWIFHSKSIPTAENRSAGANRGRYVNHELDKLLDAARQEMDQDKRKALYNKVQAILARDLPYISLWHEDNILVIDKDVQDYQIVPNARFRGLEKAKVVPSGSLPL